MPDTLKKLLKAMLGSMRDLLPIVVVILFFQFAVLQQPLPNIGQLLVGILFVILGLTFFIHGLKQGLFPIGETMAHEFARKSSVLWLLVFAFALGFGTTVAEPALIAVAAEGAACLIICEEEDDVWRSWCLVCVGRTARCTHEAGEQEEGDDS